MSTSTFSDRLAGFSKILAAVVALLLLGTLLLALTGRDGKRYVTVDFPQTNSLYQGSDVKILGVAVGRVEKLTPRGDVVRAKLSYEGDVKLPQDVKAVIVSPAIVGDRFVQLAPAYDGGAALKDDAFLPVTRAAVPVELDTVYRSLDDLSVALGPKGANSEGALSRLVDDTAGQLDGQGAKLNTTIKNFGKLSTTLDNNKDELFGSLREVRDFVQLLKSNDQAVRDFNDSTARVSTVLAGERDDLQATLRELSLALVDVNKLVKDNRGELRQNVKNLRTLTDVLAKRTPEVEEITKAAPTALVNVALAYNPQLGSLDTRANIEELLGGTLNDPASLLCELLGEAPGSTELCDALGQLPLEDVLGALGTLGAAPTGAPSLNGQGGLPDSKNLDDLSGSLNLPRTAPSSHRSVTEMLAVK